jgi:hypothetical protein
LVAPTRGIKRSVSFDDDVTTQQIPELDAPKSQLYYDKEEIRLMRQADEARKVRKQTKQMEKMFQMSNVTASSKLPSIWD